MGGLEQGHCAFPQALVNPIAGIPQKLALRAGNFATLSTRYPRPPWVPVGLERQLAKLTDGLIFESDYSRRVYEAKIGEPPCPARVVPNGLLPDEFTDHQPIAKAADVLFVGELRALKGVDVLLGALARTAAPRPPTALIVGLGAGRDGVQGACLLPGAGRAGAVRRGDAGRARFSAGASAGRPLARESFPYIVLEGAAAGMPMLLSDVGGIPEITAGTSARLLPPGDADALSARLSEFLADPARLRAATTELRARVAGRFTVARMAADILDFYQTVAPGQSPGLAPAQILTGG